MKKITKKQREAFVSSAMLLIEKLGAKRTEGLFNSMYPHTICTRHGDLQVSIDENPHTVYTIFARFVDVDRIPPVLYPKANHYSGKWNFHEYSADECLDVFEIAVKKIAVTGE